MIARMSDFVYEWFGTAGKDGSTTLDGTDSYDGADGAEAFISDLVGTPLLWITPKTDWTSADFYNFGDLDRVESNTDHLAALLLYWTGLSIALVTITSRDISSIDFYDSLNRIEGNIKLLADNYYVPVGWISPVLTWASGQAFDWTDANRLETDLLLFLNMLTGTIDNTPICGTLNTGHERGALGGLY